MNDFVTRRLPLLCFLLLAIHWLNQLAGTYGLMFDESQYWFWAKHPAWGYYSKPPVIAWLIALSTSMFGDGNFGVKMLSPVILLATGFVLRATALRMGYDKRTAAWVMLTYLTIPFATSSAMFFTTDVPLDLCWAIAMYCILTAWQEQRGRYWVYAALAAGMGCLSKYTMVAFAASAFLAMVASPDLRPQLRKPWPWLAALIAAALFAPNILWNAQHQFVTFRHTDDNVFSKAVEIYPVDMLEFIAAQFVVFGPILLVALVANLLSLLRTPKAQRSANAIILHSFVWPLAVAGVIVSLLAGAQAHWISPVYLAGTLIVVPYLLQQKPRWLRASLILHLLLLLAFYAAPTVIPMLQLKHDPLARAFAWNALADTVRPLAEAHPDAVLMTNERKIAAALTYQLRDLRGAQEPVYKVKITNQMRDHYDLLSAEQDFSQRERLVILRDTCPGSISLVAHATPLKCLALQHYQFAIYLLPPDAKPLKGKPKH